MQQQELFTALKLTKPWVIKQVREDLANQRLVVELTLEGKKRSWFGSTKVVTCFTCNNSSELSNSTKIISMRHINVDNYEVYLQAPQLEVGCGRINADCALRLIGTTTLPYSRLLEQQIRQFANMPNGTNVAANKLRLTQDEVEDLIKAGWLPRVDSLPLLTNPIWQDLVTHRIQFKTQNLGLQCLLTWASGQFRRDNMSEEDKLSKINMVRGYFEKYRHTLQSELEQLVQARGML